jgi:nitroreductase
MNTSTSGSQQNRTIAATLVEACLEAAAAAPSVHNTQPWRFLPRPNSIDVYADRERQLHVIDPRGREMSISLGAAVFNLRVAILYHGRLPLTLLLPEPDQPDLVARVIVGPPTSADPTVRALAEAIPRRHTNRRPFTEVSIPDQTIDELAAAVRAEGAWLTVAGQIERDWVLSLVRSAEIRLRSDAGYRRELTAWTTVHPNHRDDGIPSAVIGPWDAMETLPLRDFGLTHLTEPRRTARFEPDPTLVVISTAGDTREQWLRAGQALERMLLTAAVRGVAATPMSQPLEIPELRELLADPETPAYPQLILRIGYGRSCPASPRRPVSDMLMPAPPA